MDERDSGDQGEQVTMDVEIAGGRTVISISGDRDAAVVVRSESGERVYLPPEDFDRPVETTRLSPYDGAETPYDGPGRRVSGADDPGAGGTPYAPTQVQQSPGLESTPDGFQILHPEPVTDLRLLR
jgi:hypothetical protein